MKQLSTILMLLFCFTISKAQQINDSVKVRDTLAFIKSKRINDKDLILKKEGRFLTGIPELSSDPVTGFGFGVRTNTYWNGTREDSLFAYTPYLMRLRANASWYTSNAKELFLSLDIPYYKGTRWRFRVDFKAQQNPANLYFGLTEATLGKLHLPSDLNTTFDTYKAYNNARKLLRAGENGEAVIVTDALSNRFRETEFMLNLKADYAIGNGKWRIMAGYEIQHLSYKTFEGMDAAAVDPLTGNKTEAPNGFSLLRRHFDDQQISGLNGGWVSIIQNALIYDTRDFEPDATKGLYVEIANEYSSKLIGSQFDFDKLFIQGRYFQKLPVGSRTIFAGRVGIGHIFGSNAPFFEYQDQWSPEGSINALGGRSSLRGYRANRFLARSMWFANLEMRIRIAETAFLNQHLSFNVVPFFDMGTVRDSWQNLSFKHLKTSYGSGLRIGWNQSTTIYFDYGISKEDKLFFFGIGQSF
ncbi:Omp85 family outer membrane protein [Gynurincola endophyticus]|uniref:Omp85 family outer membrane protein n=1 Tax=Gynurincola endophyticus TaxID=2479004 RepID=UPI0018F2FB7A|nr:DUF5982 domain-containing protein [Gynurincola endophyticus]